MVLLTLFGDWIMQQICLLSDIGSPSCRWCSL